MAKGTNRTAIALGAIVLIAIVLIGGGIIDPQSLNLGQRDQGAGMQVTPTPTPVVGAGFAGQLDLVVTHRDQLDNAEARIEATNLATTWYKSFDEVSFFTIGSGTGIAVTIDSAQNSILYAGVQVPSGQNFLVSPSGTADQNLNPNVIDFAFADITGDGIKEWYFKIDLSSIPIPVAGQTASTFNLFLNSYDYDGALAINAPANITGVGTGGGAQSFIRWEMTVTEETASPQFEYEIRIDNTATEKWERSLSTLTIPNVGIVSLDSFDETTTSTETIYRWTLGSNLDNANFVTVPQNGNEVITIPFKIVTNLAGSDNLAVQLTIKEKTPSQGTNTVTDTVNVLET